jgi:hypothetical protein
MSCYISSNANRLYTAMESSFGQVAAITEANRFPAVKFTARQQTDVADRRDKTGSRTFAGVPAGSRRRTIFGVKTYMTSWSQSGQPGYGPLFQAALGGAPLHFSGGVVAAGSTETVLALTAAHGLVPGQGVAYGGEIRFVDSVVDATRVQVNAPFSSAPAAGAPAGPTVTYFPATELESLSIFDYWNPATAVQRILCGGAVDKMRVTVNGDYHEFEFSGGAQDLIDSASFTSGLGQLTDFPAEPAPGAFDYTIIPGHLGEAWLGTGPDRFYSITSAEFLLDNDLDLRAREFGSAVPRCLAPGRRSVYASFDLYENDDGATKGLYQAARQQSPVPVMFQLGQQPGRLFGVYLKSVVPEVPEFDDSDRRLSWKFTKSRAQGALDDEIAVAFG